LIQILYRNYASTGKDSAGRPMPTTSTITLDTQGLDDMVQQLIKKKATVAKAGPLTVTLNKPAGK
jgi:hypothetical protein